MRIYVLPISLLTLLVACGQKTTGDTNSNWWDTSNTSTDSSGGGGGGEGEGEGEGDDDDEGEDDDEGSYTGFYMEGTRGSDGSFSGWAGYEQSSGSEECVMEFEASGVSAEACSGCEGALTVTLGESTEQDGSCGTISGLPAQNSGDSFTIGWSSSDVQLYTDGSWTSVAGEVFDEEDIWGIFIDLDGGGEEDDEEDEGEEEGEEDEE